MDINIVDKDGKWYSGLAQLGVRDPFTQVMFPFNMPVKVSPTAWIDGQVAAGVIQPCADPLAVDPPVPVDPKKGK
jgi:hypothetical protein